MGVGGETGTWSMATTTMAVTMGQRFHKGHAQEKLGGSNNISSSGIPNQD
jgi:hypothetical protein